MSHEVYGSRYLTTHQSAARAAGEEKPHRPSGAHRRHDLHRRGGAADATDSVEFLETVPPGLRVAVEDAHRRAVLTAAPQQTANLRGSFEIESSSGVAVLGVRRHGEAVLLVLGERAFGRLRNGADHCLAQTFDKHPQVLEHDVEPEARKAAPLGRRSALMVISMVLLVSALGGVEQGTGDRRLSEGGLG